MNQKLYQKTRKLLDDEKGTIFKSHGGKIMVALVFPNSYHVGMSNLGFQTVYRILNDLPDVVCERAFLPDPIDLAEMHRTRTPLFTLESQTPVADFDIMAFSISFEMDYAHVLGQLELCGLPLRSEDRDESHPLVIAGGPAININPEPVAEFLDACGIGDGEEMIPDLMEVIRRCGDRPHGAGPAPRNELLAALSTVEGLYVPRFYTVHADDRGLVTSIDAEPGFPNPVHRRLTRDLSKHNPTGPIVTPNTEFANMLLTEVARGCARGCRFCFAGYGYRPVRYRKTEDVEPLKLLQCSGAPARADAPRVGLVGSSLSDNPNISPIARGFADAGFQVSVASLRAETTRKDLTATLGASGVRQLTLAPEAGSERLRRAIKKPMKEEALQQAVANAVEGGIEHIKFYFMLNLPTETDDDVADIGRLSRRVMQAHALKSLTSNVNPLVPKPFTPFQWHAQDTAREAERKRKIIESEIRGARGIRLTMASAREMEIQGLLARGGRSLSRLILTCHRLGGDWRAAIREEEIDLEHHLRRERGRHEIHPWNILDLDLKTDFLWEEYQLALQGKVYRYETRPGYVPAGAAV